MNNNEKTNHDDHEKKDNKYVCYICNQSFSSGHALGGHKGTHFSPNPTITIDLTRDFDDDQSNSNLTHVQELHHMCKICHQNFPSRQDLDGHIRLHYVVPCSTSGSGLGSSLGSGHIRYVCNICDKSFSSGHAIERHMGTVKNVPIPNQTLDLARSFNDWYKLSNLTHYKELHKCKICDSIFLSGQDLEGHMRSLHIISCSRSRSRSRSRSGSGQSSSQTGQGVGRTIHEFDLNLPAVAEDEDAGVE